MLTVWQDFDENWLPGWGLWWVSYSQNGHIVWTEGGFETEAEARTYAAGRV